MTKYRFEILDANGKVSERRHIDCGDQDAALDRARILLVVSAGASGIEVWDGTYLVQCLKKAGV
jgi:hypothetical protein